MSNKRAQEQSVVTAYIEERADIKKNINLIPLIIFICHEGFIMKPILLIKKTAVQNVRDLERKVILKGALEHEQPWESWDTQMICGFRKWK